ncbi:MAG: hypothetical protein ABR878_11995 [Roseiarcus sp.]
MKLAIALLLGSAAAVSAATGAGAAELPSRNATPPAAKAETCSVDGAPGVRLPGGQTCVRISGAISAGVSAGSLSRQRHGGEP